ncbi:hypothetical protein HK096_007482 [Nowakowskiella sp. JEL0078]|nr:hypothetical protein HK096_007482 [Nowakowskiella sp. JEL0078]
MAQLANELRQKEKSKPRWDSKKIFNCVEGLIAVILLRSFVWGEQCEYFLRFLIIFKGPALLTPWPSISTILTQPVDKWLRLVFHAFLWHVIFDFIYYWGHRTCHSIPAIYKIVHKRHHTFTYPSIYTFYYATALEHFCFALIPSLIAFPALRGLNGFEITLIGSSVLLVEVMGHSGRMSTGSFPIFHMLVKWLNIRLVTEHHDLHHRLGSVNFSKQLMIWDKIWGTYSPAEETERRKKSN